MFQIPSAPQSTFPTFPLSYHTISEHCKARREILNLILALGKKIIHLLNSMTSDPVTVRVWTPIFFFSFQHAPFWMKWCGLMGWPKTKRKEKQFSMPCAWKMGCCTAGGGHLCPRWMSPAQLMLGSATQLTNVLFPTTNTAFVNLAGGLSRNGWILAYPQHSGAKGTMAVN